MAERKQLNFVADQATIDMFNELKAVYGVDSRSAVLKRALALARIAAESRAPGSDTVTIVDKSGETPRERDVIMRG